MPVKLSKVVGPGMVRSQHRSVADSCGFIIHAPGDVWSPEMFWYIKRIDKASICRDLRNANQDPLSIFGYIMVNRCQPVGASCNFRVIGYPSPLKSVYPCPSSACGRRDGRLCGRRRRRCGLRRAGPALILSSSPKCWPAKSLKQVPIFAARMPAPRAA